jgi:hypothetical protein
MIRPEARLKRVHFKVKPGCSLESREALFMLGMGSGTVLRIPIAVRSPGWNEG